jgi:hypothetical protein
MEMVFLIDAKPNETISFIAKGYDLKASWLLQNWLKKII